MFHASKLSFKNFLKTLTPFLGLEVGNRITFIMTFIFLGSFGDPLPIAAFGINNLLINIVILPVIISIIEVFGTLTSMHYGAKKYSETITDFYKTIAALIFLFFFYFILTLFSEFILLSIGIDPIVAQKSSYLFKWSIIFTGFAIVSRFFQVFMSSQGKIKEFLVINIISMFLGVSLSYLFIVHLQMKQNGIIPARIIQTAVSAVYSIYIFCTQVDPKTIGKLDFKSICTENGIFAKRLTINAFGTVLEWITFEFNTYLATQMHDLHELVVVLTFNGVSSIFFIFGNGFSSTIRVIIGKLAGEEKVNEMKMELIAFFFYIFIFSLFNMIVLLFFNVQIAWLFIKEIDLSISFSKTLIFLSFSQWAYMMFYPIFQVFRIFEMEKFFIGVLGTYYFFLNAIIVVILVFYFGMESLGFTIGHGVSATFSILIFLRKIFWIIEWDKLGFNRKQNDKQEELILVKVKK